jgi:hypothetical protein
MGSRLGLGLLWQMHGLVRGTGKLGESPHPTTRRGTVLCSRTQDVRCKECCLLKRNLCSIR